MRRKQFIWKTAKGLICCFTTAHVSVDYNTTDTTIHWKSCILTYKVKALGGCLFWDREA